MLMIARQQQVGLEQPVDELEEGQDIVVQRLQLTPECPRLGLQSPSFGIHRGGLHGG